MINNLGTGTGYIVVTNEASTQLNGIYENVSGIKETILKLMVGKIFRDSAGNDVILERVYLDSTTAYNAGVTEGIALATLIGAPAVEITEALIDPYVGDGIVLTGNAITVDPDGTTLELSGGKVQVADDGIDKTKIAADVAGVALSQAAGGELDVGVDNTSIEVSGGNLQVKALGIDTAELAANAVTTAKITDANVTTAKIADDNVTPAKVDEDMRWEEKFFHLSWEATYKGVKRRIYLPRNCRLEKIKSFVTVLIEASNNATIDVNLNGASIATHTITAASAAGTENTTELGDNATLVTAGNYDTLFNYVDLTPQKITAGGEADVTLWITRKQG